MESVTLRPEVALTLRLEVETVTLKPEALTLEYMENNESSSYPYIYNIQYIVKVNPCQTMQSRQM